VGAGSADGAFTDSVSPFTHSVNPVTDSVSPVTDSVSPVTDSVSPVTDSVNPVTDLVTPVTDSVSHVTSFAASLPSLRHSNPGNTMTRAVSSSSSHPEAVHTNPTKGSTIMSRSVTKSSTKATTPDASTTTKEVPVVPAVMPAMAAAATFSGLNVAAGPPNVPVPSAPDGFEATSMAPLRGLAIRTSEVVLLPMVMNDLANFTDYDTTLGSGAPDPATFVADIQVALKWRASRNGFQSYTEYLKVGDAMAWQAVMPALEALKSSFALAVAKDPDLATTYRGLAALFSARKSTARKASLTKRENAKAKAVATSTASTAAPEAPTAPSPKVTITT
jgi:hypothetical protein